MVINIWMILPPLFAYLAYRYATHNDRNPIFWAVLAFLTCGFALVFLYNIGRSYKNWPTLDEYLSQNPSIKLDKGIKCYKCGSNSIRNWGLSSIDDRDRAHSCNHCGSTLFVTRQ